MKVTYLIDSNVFIDYLGNKFNAIASKKLDKIFDSGFHFSIISRIEVLGFDATEEELLELRGFLSFGVIHHLTEDITEKVISIRQQAKANQKKNKLLDVIIGATALVHNHVLITSNVEDFDSISELKVLNPRKWNGALSDEDLESLIDAI